MATETASQPPPGTRRVFVLMPFAPAFDGVYAAIKRAAASVEAFASRVDEQLFDSLILQRVYNQITMADVIVAEMTGRNANVFYEVGYAHALGRRVILLTQQASDIPFDLSQYPHIVYGGDCELLESELRVRLEHYVGIPTVSSLTNDVTVLGKLEIFINDAKPAATSAIKAPACRIARDSARANDVGFGGKLGFRLDMNNTDAFASYRGGAQLSIQTSRRILNMTEHRREGDRQSRRVPLPEAFAFWPDWRLHELWPSEGMTYTASFYCSENERFAAIEPFVLTFHFKGHPVRYEADIEPVETSGEKFDAWFRGLSTL